MEIKWEMIDVTKYFEWEIQKTVSRLVQKKWHNEGRLLYAKKDTTKKKGV
jgi:hypothetical protein